MHKNKSGTILVPFILFVVGTTIGGIATYELFGKPRHLKQARQVVGLVEQHDSCIRKYFANDSFPSETEVNSFDYTGTGCYEFNDNPPHYEIVTNMVAGKPDTITVTVSGLPASDLESDWSSVSNKDLHEALDFVSEDSFYRGRDGKRFIFSMKEFGS